MSTEIAKIGRIALTQFHGGAVRGVCIQITDTNVKDEENMGCGYIQLTEHEALDLANALINWYVERKDGDHASR